MSTKGKDSQPHIGIFGRTNTGKSSLLNTLTGQELAIVSEQAGTTTDPVKKTIEIHGLGPAVVIDTAGTEDMTNLGQQRLKKTLSVLQKIDLAILVIDHNGFKEADQKLINKFETEALPYLIVQNKSDLIDSATITQHPTPPLPLGAGPRTQYPRFRWGQAPKPSVSFSCKTPTALDDLIQLIKQQLPEESYQSSSLIGDLIRGGDTVVLVTPIDDEAPAGRLILPQVQLIRDILDNDALAVVLKERELDAWMQNRSTDPALVITDSQAFPKVSGSVPDHIPLTSFSIVLARKKGNFDSYIQGTRKISTLTGDDKILILESCTHQVSCDDIGRVKIPRWLNQFTGLHLNYQVVTSHDDLPDDLGSFALVIQCGGCVMTSRQVSNRIRKVIKNNVPVSNYGMAISFVHGIFHRAVKPFGYCTESHKDYL